MQAIDNLIRLGGRPNEGGDPLGFLGYYKRVESVDQMVPFFTCIPNIRVDSGVQNALVNMKAYVPRALFPHTTELIQKLGNTTIMSLIANAMINFVTGSTLNSTERSLVRLAVTLSSWKHANTWDKQTGLNILSNFKASLLKGANPKDANSIRAKVKNTAMVMVDSAYPEYQAGYDEVGHKRARDTGWVYGLYLPQRVQNFAAIAHPEATMKQIIMNVDKLPSCTIQRVAGSTIGVVNHFCYMGTTPKQPKKPYKFMGFFPKLALQQPNNSIIDGNLYNTLAGVRSLFCLMIRAKARPYASLMMMLGLADQLEFEKGDIELWEDASIRTALGDNYKEYVKTIQSNVRNKMQSPVRVFPNLTKQLFTIDEAKEVNEVQLALEATSILSRARYVSSYVDSTSSSWTHRDSSIKWSPVHQVRHL